MMDPQIEDKIIRHFCAQDGTWLVDRAVICEAMMLKEAVARIEDLKARIRELEAAPTQPKTAARAARKETPGR